MSFFHDLPCVFFKGGAPQISKIEEAKSKVKVCASIFFGYLGETKAG